MAGSLIIYSKDDLLVFTWNKNSSSSIHEYCRSYNFTETTDTSLSDRIYNISISIVQDPVIRWLKGFATYIHYNNLGQTVRDAIFGRENGFKGIDIQGILLELVKSITSNFKNFDLDEHTDLIYSVEPYASMDKSNNYYIESSYVYELPKVFNRLFTDIKFNQIGRVNQSDNYQKLLHKELFILNETNEEFNSSLEKYLKPDIDCYTNYEILNNERAIRRCFYQISRYQ